MSLPNYLTLFRILLVPVLVAVLLTGTSADNVLTINARLLAVAIFGFAALTDALDGYLARLRKETTRLGKLLDPIADKFLISAAFVALVQIGLAPAWIVVIILGREFAVSGLRLLAASEGIQIEISEFGKYKMVAQVFAVGFLIFSPNTWWIGLACLYIVMFLALLSMVLYFHKFWTKLLPGRRRELARRRTFREMKESLFTTTRTIRERGVHLREQRRKKRLERRLRRQEKKAFAGGPKQRRFSRFYKMRSAPGGRRGK